MLPELESKQLNCACSNPPFSSDNYITRSVGIDHTNSRYGEVSILQCKFCNTLWIEYFYENNYSESGRWFKGRISEELSKNILPEQTVAYLEQLDEYFYGGSFFRTIGAKGKGKLHL